MFYVVAAAPHWRVSPSVNFHFTETPEPPISKPMQDAATASPSSHDSELLSEALGVIQPKGFPGLPPGWTTQTEIFLSADKSTQLFAVSHQRAEGHRALVILHGMGEHSGRYLHVPHYMQDAVDMVYCHDHRGHGRSQGLRGHADRFDSLADDSALAIRRVHEKLMDRFGKAEIHLLGHSLGGHLALRTLFLNPNLPVASASISAPFLGVAMKVPVSKKLAALALARVWGNLQLTTELDPTLVSHDPEVCSAYAADKLVHGKMTPKFYQGLVRAMVNTLTRKSGIKAPLLMLIPLADKIVDSTLSQRFFRELQISEKSLKLYPDFFHEILNETGKDQVFADIREWILKHPSR